MAKAIDRTELAKAAYHAAFDIHHFRFQARLLKEGRLTTFHPAISQSFLYSLLLHFRLLLDFFYRDPRGDDCWVGHFRMLPEFSAAFPPAIHVPPIWLDQVRPNLNKRLAHMTATRWREKQPDMDYYAKHFADIEKLIVAFQAALPAHPNDVRESLDGRLHELEVQYSGSL